MSSKESSNPIYNEEKFLKYKEKMKDTWMKGGLDLDLLIRNTSDFFNKINHDYDENCLLIELLRFQCQYRESISLPTVPYFVDFSSSFSTLTRNFKKRSYDNKIINYITNEKNSIITNYFWNVFFPNAFGSFISYEHCESAYNFLEYSKNESFDFYSNGVISFIQNNYLFQNAFLNSFYTRINKKNDNGYIWCQYDFNVYKNIIQEALIEASQQLNSHQISSLQNLHECNSKKAEELVFNKIVLNNIKYVWPYSPLFIPNEMLYIKKTRECYLLNDLEKENNLSFIQDFFKKLKDISKFSGRNDIYLTCLYNCQPDINIFTKFDLILLDFICNAEVFPKESEILKSIKNKSSELVDFIFNNSFIFCYLGSQLPAHSIKFPIGKEDKLKNLSKKWEKHVIECKKRNENPLSPIFNNQPFDKDLAFFGLRHEYYVYKSKKVLSQKLEIFIPLNNAKIAQDRFIQIYSFRLAESLKQKNHVPNLFLSISQSHFFKLFYENASSILFRNDSPYQNIFKQIYEKIFDDCRKQNESKFMEIFNDLYAKPNGYQDMLNFFSEFVILLKSSFCDSIQREKEIKDTEEDQLIKYCNSSTIESEVSKIFKYSLDFLNKIDFAFTFSHFMDVPLDLKLTTTNVQLPQFKKLFEFFDQKLDDTGVFSYIKSVFYNLYTKHSSNQVVLLGELYISIQVILEMLEQFYITQSESDNLQPHPCLQKLMTSRVTDKSKSDLAKSIFRFSLSNNKLILYKKQAQKNDDNSIEMFSFVLDLLNCAIDDIDKKKYQKDFPPIDSIYEQLNTLSNIIQI